VWLWTTGRPTRDCGGSRAGNLPGIFPIIPVALGNCLLAPLPSTPPVQASWQFRQWTPSFSRPPRGFFFDDILYPATKIHTRSRFAPEVTCSVRNQKISLLLSSTLIFVGMFLLTNMIFPPKPAENVAAAQENGKEGEKAGQTENPGKLAEVEPVAPAVGDSKQAADVNQDSSPPATTEAESVKSAVSPVAPRFYTLGSLNANSDDRYLITFSDYGGVVTRVELNSRDPRGRQRYQDLTHFGGYIGKLQLNLIAGETVVGVVGPGTPAAEGGLKVGDAIRSFNGEPVTDPANFDSLLEKVAPDQRIELEVRRKTGDSVEAIKLSIQSSEQPLELLRPEFNAVGAGTFSPPSFQLTLRKPPAATDAVQTSDWPELDSMLRSVPWKVTETNFEGRPALEFSYTVENEKLARLGLAGPVEVIKRYWLPKLDDATRNTVDSRTFHFNLQVIVRNLADQKQLLGLELDGPTGATTEGWWYQNKINGDSAKFGYTAGARDVVGSTAANSFYFYGCPEIVSNLEKPSPRFLWIANPNVDAADTKHREVKYLGVDTQYFNISLFPVQAADNSSQQYRCYSALASTASSTLPKQASLKRLVDTTFYLFEKFEIEPQGQYSQRYEIFAGPKEVGLLQAYGLEDTRSFGWFAWFSKFICWLLTVLYKLTFSFSYGIAIILLTVLVRILMIPLSRKAALNAQMMQLLAPEMKAIADKYKDDMEKRAQAQKELFRRHRYNPFGGCFLVFLQIPVFIGLYRGLSVDIALRDQPLIPGMRWCSNLAAPDSLLYWKEWMPGFLADETGWFGPWLNILPIFTVALFLIQQKMFTPPPADEQQAVAQKTMNFMMIFMGVMFFKVPAGLCIYFITSSLWGIAERKLLPKPKLSEDKVAEIKGVTGSPSGAAPKGASGLMDRLRDAIEQRQKPAAPLDPEEQKKQDRDRKRRMRDRGN
jgi:YidC/Oxa1 family membrane protein insertase